MTRHGSTIAALAAVFALATAHSAAAQQINGTFSIATLPPGTSFNATAAGIARLFHEHNGAQMRLREAGTGLDDLVGGGETDFGLGSTPSTHDAYAGLGTYKGKAFPDERIVIMGPPLYGSLMAPKSLGITMVSQLKGKRVPGEFPGAEAFREDISAALHAAGIGWNDVKVIPVAGIRENYQAFLNGQTDCANASIGSGVVSQADAQYHGVLFLGLPPGPETSRLLAESKVGYYGIMLKAGSFTGIVHDTTVWEKDIQVTTSKSTPDDVVYAMAKTIWDHVRELDGAHPVMKLWTQAGMSAPRFTAPMHEAAIKFFKEKGVWDADHEALQKRLLALHGGA
jgi:uncharacterized protein